MNPLPVEEGGYGKPLGNKDGADLTGLMKVKLKASGHRIVYQVVREKSVMKIIIIGVREDSKVYKEAHNTRDGSLCQMYFLTIPKLEPVSHQEHPVEREV